MPRYRSRNKSRKDRERKRIRAQIPRDKRKLTRWAVRGTHKDYDTLHRHVTNVRDQAPSYVQPKALDVLQTIPVLSFLPPVTLALITLVPGSELGLEFACIVMIFTGQAWNVAFGFYQSICQRNRDVSLLSVAPAATTVLTVTGGKVWKVQGDPSLCTFNNHFVFFQFLSEQTDCHD